MTRASRTHQSHPAFSVCKNTDIHFSGFQNAAVKWDPLQQRESTEIWVCNINLKNRKLEIILRVAQVNNNFREFKVVEPHATSSNFSFHEKKTRLAKLGTGALALTHLASVVQNTSAWVETLRVARLNQNNMF